MIAIDMGDSAETIQKYVKQANLTFPIGMDNAGVVGKYGVNAFPTNYVVDADGKVAFRTIGFDEAGIRAALAKLGVK